MLKIDIFHRAGCARVRLHYHQGDANAPCDDGCDYEATERAYHSHKSTPADYRKTTAAAVLGVLFDPAVSNAEWQFMVGEQDTIPGL